MRGVRRTLPARWPHAIKNPKGLCWEYQCAAANPAIASWLQSNALVGRVAELGSLIWLNHVKRAVLLFSERFHCFQFRVTAAWLRQRQERFVSCGCSMLRCVSPLAGRFQGARSYQQVTVRRGVHPQSRHEGRIGYRLKRPSGVTPDRVPASGSSKFRGRCHHQGLSLLFLKVVFFFAAPSGGKRSHTDGGTDGAGRGLTIRPMAQRKPASSRPSAAAATGDFLRPAPTRCW